MSTRLFPPLPPELVAFVERGLSLIVGTRSADLIPHAMRAVGVRIWPGASQLTVYLPVATAARAVANLCESGAIAITMSWPATHETIQIKGSVREVRDANESDRAVVDAYHATFIEVFKGVGLLPQVTHRLNCWPAHAIDIEIAEVFAQTPGPGAGTRMTAP